MRSITDHIALVAKENDIALSGLIKFEIHGDGSGHFRHAIGQDRIFESFDTLEQLRAVLSRPEKGEETSIKI